MAKISARGATEVARVTGKSANGVRYIYVVCSDGRILRRATGDLGSGYKVLGKVVESKRTRQYLEALVAAHRLEVVA